MHSHLPTPPPQLLQDVHVLIPETCEYVTVHGHTFADEKIILDYPGGSNEITKVLIKWRQEGPVSEKEM